MKTLQEQLDYAHAQFDHVEEGFNWVWSDKHASDLTFDMTITFDRYEQKMEMWMSIINSLTELMLQESRKRDQDLWEAKAQLATEKISHSMRQVALTFRWRPE
jgi:hypothetical protein